LMPGVGFDNDTFTNYGELSGATLSDILAYAIPLCDNSPGWAITSAVAFSGGFVYTTNGKAAARIVCPDLDNNFSATPHFSAIATLSRISSSNVAVSRSDRVLLFEGIDFVMRTGEVDCQVPDLDGVLFAPARVNHTLVEDVASLRNGIEGCVMFGDASSPARLEMRLEFEPEQVVVCSAGDELRLAVGADSNFSDVIAFNSRYLLAAIKAMGNSFDMFAINAASPVLFRGEACDYVLFPMRL